MTQDRYALRREKLLRRLKTAGIGELLVTSPANVRYLTGFTGEDSYLIVGRALTVLISDSRFETQIAAECPALEVHIRSRVVTMTQAVTAIVRQAKLSKLGFESASTTYAQWEALSRAISPAELVPAEGHVEALRIIKDADEIAEIREAIRQAERGFQVVRASLRDEQTESEAASDLEHAMRRFGAKQASFEIMVAAGERSALPHARPGTGRIGDADFVLIDWGATSAGGYRSDLTRFLVTGTISPKVQKLYGVVLRAQRRGIEAIRPGIQAKQVDAAARAVITDAGYGKHFGHGLGHGIGLEIHEAPRVSQNSETELKPGMIVTVEPGIYLPGWGGIRIEDDVLVTRTGHEVLTSLPKEFDDAVVG